MLFCDLGHHLSPARSCFSWKSPLFLPPAHPWWSTCSIPLWFITVRTAIEWNQTLVSWDWVHLCRGVYLNLPDFMYVCVCTSVLMVMCVHVCVWVCVHVCTCVWMYECEGQVNLWCHSSGAIHRFFFFKFSFIDEGNGSQRRYSICCLWLTAGIWPDGDVRRTTALTFRWSLPVLYPMPYLGAIPFYLISLRNVAHHGPWLS